MKLAPIEVTYVDHMGSDKTVINAARASFNKVSEGDITDRDISLIKFLARGYSSEEWDTVANTLALSTDSEEIKQIMWTIKNKATHFIPFAHPQISVRVTAPLAIARQCWKSHVGASGGDVGYPAWSEESRRYLDNTPDFYMPDVFRVRADNVKQGSGGIADGVLHTYAASSLSQAYKSTEREYSDLLEEGIAPEQARLSLSTGMMVTWTWTGSIAFFARLCQLRMDAHAQKESGDVVFKIGDIVSELFPVCWEALMTGDVK
jgi:thymidylate synthase (FAD)